MLRAGLPVRDKLIERNDGREVRHHPSSERGAARRGVRAGTGRSPRTAQTQEAKGDTSKVRRKAGKMPHRPRRSNAATRG